MARITGTKQDIDRDAVLSFFESRAAKCAELGPLRAVIYQDKHPDLAEHRDRAEKALLLPKLQLDGRERVLDVGCGTGRWTHALAPCCDEYRGVDVSPGLIAIATSLHGHRANARFSICPAEEISLERLGEREKFTRIACLGVLIYLNDDAARRALGAMVECAAAHCRFVLREPVGIDDRLTIREHFSEDMDQTYNAIYRTEMELLAMLGATFLAAGFTLVEHGDVYDETDLNNRAETRQRFFVLVR